MMPFTVQEQTKPEEYSADFLATHAPKMPTLEELLNQETSSPSLKNRLIDVYLPDGLPQLYQDTLARPHNYQVEDKQLVEDLMHSGRSPTALERDQLDRMVYDFTAPKMNAVKTASAPARPIKRKKTLRDFWWIR